MNTKVHNLNNSLPSLRCIIVAINHLLYPTDATCPLHHPAAKKCIVKRAVLSQTTLLSGMAQIKGLQWVGYSLFSSNKLFC
jgi:hypothetical protein